MNKLFTSFLFSLSVLFTFAQEILWERTIGGDKSEYLYDIKATPDYGFIIAGSSFSDKSKNKSAVRKGDLDYFLWKMDEFGNEEWQKSFGGEGSDHLYSVNITHEGGFILGGSSNSTKSEDKKDINFGLEDFWIIKLDPAGNEEWQLTIGGKGTDILFKIQQTSDKGFIIGGTSNSDVGNNLKDNPMQKSQNCRGGMDYWIIKLSESGEIEWQKTLGGIHNDILKDLIQTSDNGYLLGGYSNSPVSEEKTMPNFGEGDYWLVKLDNNGNLLWDKTIGGNGDDNFSALIEVENGYLVAGNSNSNNSITKTVSNKNGTDFWVLKIDSEGEIEWNNTYDFGEIDILKSITRTSDNNFLLSGYAQNKVHSKENNSVGVDDYVVLKINIKGEELWRKIIGGDESDKLFSTIVTRDGGYVLAGTSNSGKSKDKNSANNGRDDYWIVKLLDKDNEEDVDKRKIEIYPNPTTEYVNIIINQEFKEAQLQVMDMIGALILKKTLKYRSTPIDVRQFQTGVYILKVTIGEETYSEKLIKK